MERNRGVERAGKKTDRRVLRTRKLIHDAFFELLEGYDVSEITVSAVARKADIDRKTFYAHYSSIDDLTAKEAEAVALRLVDAVSSSGVKQGPAGLNAFFSELIALTNENPLVFRRAFRSVPLNHMVSLLEGPVCEAFMKERRFSSEEDRHACSYIVRFYVSGVLAMFARYLEEDDTPTAEEIIAIVDAAAALTSDRLTVLAPQA